VQYVLSGRSTTHEGPRSNGPQATGETDYRPAPHREQNECRVAKIFIAGPLAPAAGFLRRAHTHVTSAEHRRAEEHQNLFFLRTRRRPSSSLMATDDDTIQDRKSKTRSLTATDYNSLTY